jgi:hypothetical protein
VSIQGDQFAEKQPPNVQPVQGHVVIDVWCGGKGEPVKGCKCSFCRRER